MLLLVIKASVVLVSSLAAAALLGRSAAATRHRLWSVAFALVLAVPVLAIALPAVNVTVPNMSTLENDEGPSRSIGDRPSGNRQSVVSESVPPSPENLQGPQRPSKANGLDLASIAFFVWIGGAVAALFALVLSLARVRHLSRQAVDMTDPAWMDAARTISERLGLASAPRLAVSDRVRSPMAGGILRPTVFLPPDAGAWSGELRDVVLTHEIAHLASHDPLRHLIVRAGVACYWFHPLAWLAAHRATVSREQACDEAVVAAGTRPSTYARVLMEMADALGAESAPLAALPMAQRSHLEKRLMTILNNDVRPSAARPWRLAAAALAVLTISVAAARPAASVTPLSPVPALAPVSVLPTADAPAAAVPSQAAERRGQNQGICRWNGDQREFSGTISMKDEGIITMIGRNATQQIVQRSFDGLRVCMVADEAGDRTRRPSASFTSAPHVALSSDINGRVESLEVTRSGGQTRASWRVNGQERPSDAAADQWRQSMLALLDNAWDISEINGQVSSLRGEISSIHGQESSLRGEISSVRGQVSSLDGEISSIRGQESSMRGEISSVEGHLSSLRGQISSEEGAISSLEANRYDQSTDARRQTDARIEEHRKRIDAINKEIAGYDADGKIRAIEKRMDAYAADQKVREVEKRRDSYDATAKVRAIEQQIVDLKVDDKVRDIEKQIAALDAGRRVSELEGRQADAVKRLRDAIAAIR